ncbi:TIGR04540 family protein [Planococcus shenhongbingii]|uniref:TIGR04540 family protein n=1 Tax=Planococcus shenhongbingii TaxID=3058398 RepID=UPI00260E8549|nr:TIGR04540 family protein [Planococcus sp. N016]WKA56984.1 TIGR04540 family protein [Planococcus sp. N016]
MEIKMFYRTQRDVAAAVNQLVDAYWDEKIIEQKLIDSIKDIHKNNQEKLMKNNDFTKVVQQQCGKRRLVIVERILEMN